MNMQNAGGTAYGGGDGGGPPSQYGGVYLQPLAPASSTGAGAASGTASATDNDGDLPSSLPSYMPSTAAPASLPYGGYDVIGRQEQQNIGKSGGDDQYGDAGGNGIPAKRQAPLGQWKTPPQFLYPANPAATQQPQQQSQSSRVSGVKGNRIDGSGQSSPSTGLRSMTFQETAPVYGANTAAAAPSVMLNDDKANVMRLSRQNGPGISAAQFAASTGGLTMDTALLARVSGTDPSMMGSEEIKQIMRTPDLLSIYQKLQEEDDRRQRRLERNRASARVRREKKKSMVETYEAEVSKLENSLNLLRSHSFGSGQAQELISALEYSSGEHLRHALMSKESKMDLLARILGQQARSTDAIRHANAENMVLLAAATDDTELSRSLRTQLCLTEDQCRQLQATAHYVRDEARKLDAISKCFSALRAHDWLYFPGTEGLLQQTRNTMTPQQFQKFLSWTSDNKEIIEELQVVPSGNIPESEKSLEFSFGEE